MPKLRERHLKIALFVLGLCLRAYADLARGVSSDDLTSVSFVLDPSWSSALWDNAPPTFYLFMKTIALLSNDLWVLRSAAFAVSGISFLLLFLEFEKEEDSAWILAFWALYPTSVVNATFRPTVFAEISGVLLFLAMKRGSLPKIAAAVVALAFSSYLSFVAPVVALADVDRRKKPLWILLAAGIIVSSGGMLFIRWNSLVWLSPKSSLDLVRSSFLMLSQLWGFSLPLFLVICWVLGRARAMPRSMIAIILMVLAGPLLTGYQFLSSRFLISVTPWVIGSVALALRLRTDWPARLLIVTIPAVTTVWFLMHEKSGWLEAGRFAAETGQEAILYCPPTMAHLFSPRFIAARGALDEQIAKNLPHGGWILRPVITHDTTMTAFLNSGGNSKFAVEESRTFSENALEPVRAVRVRAR